MADIVAEHNKTITTVKISVCTLNILSYFLPSAKRFLFPHQPAIFRKVGGCSLLKIITHSSFTGLVKDIRRGTLRMSCQGRFASGGK